MAKLKTLTRIFEGRFKNIYSNMRHIMVGQISSSTEGEVFYNEVDLQTSKQHVTGSWGLPKHLTKRRSID